MVGAGVIHRMASSENGDDNHSMIDFAIVKVACRRWTVVINLKMNCRRRIAVCKLWVHNSLIIIYNSLHTCKGVSWTLQPQLRRDGKVKRLGELGALGQEHPDAAWKLGKGVHASAQAGRAGGAWA